MSSSQDMKIVHDGTAACLEINLKELNDTKMIMTIGDMNSEQ